MICLQALDPTMASTRKISSIESAIYLLRGRRVMLDSDLAAIYGVSTRQLNQQLKRNRSRFPDDFAFQLSTGEFRNLKSQIATSSLMSPSVTSKEPGRARSPSAPQRTASRKCGIPTLARREYGRNSRNSRSLSQLWHSRRSHSSPSYGSQCRLHARSRLWRHRLCC